MKAHGRFVATATFIWLACTVAANASAWIGTSPATTYAFSSEGLGLAGEANVTLPDIAVAIGNNLTYQDDVLLVLTGVTPVAPTPTPTLVTCQTTPTAIGYVTTITGGWAFRVTSVSGISIGELCVFKGLKVKARSLAGSPGTLIYNALRFQTGQLVDSAVNPVAGDPPAISVRSQFTISPVQKLNGIVDVYADRKLFANPETAPPGNAGSPKLNDTLNFTTSVDANGVVFSPPTVAPFLTRVEIIGDWAWLESGDSNSTCDAAEFGSALNGYAGWSVNETSSCQKLVLDQGYPLGANTTAVTGYVDVPGTVPLDPTNWVGTAQWNYYLTGNSALTGTTRVDWDPGAWTINGAQVYIQYLPYGAELSRIIYVANAGVQAAAVSGTVYHDGSTHECSLGVAGPRAVTEFTGAVDACVAGAGVTSGRVALRLTAAAPERDIEVYSAYNVGGNDRGTVVNTSNGRTFWYGTGSPFVSPP
jgi:hypothetical protein